MRREGDDDARPDTGRQFRFVLKKGEQKMKTLRDIVQVVAILAVLAWRALKNGYVPLRT